jgi:hypothetical protein
MSEMKFYAAAMKRAIDYVATESTSAHIHSVKWTEASFRGLLNDYLDVEIETTNDEGEADYRFEMRVYKSNLDRVLPVKHEDVHVVRLNK